VCEVGPQRQRYADLLAIVQALSLRKRALEMPPSAVAAIASRPIRQ
jgi:hypothetical protein